MSNGRVDTSAEVARRARERSAKAGAPWFIPEPHVDEPSPSQFHAGVRDSFVGEQTTILGVGWLLSRLFGRRR